MLLTIQIVLLMLRQWAGNVYPDHNYSCHRHFMVGCIEVT